MMFVRPRFLGDVCLTLPLVEAARAAAPMAQVAYVVERGLAPLLSCDARFAKVIAVPPRPGLGETRTLVREIRAFAPEVVFDCFCNPRTAIWTALSGALSRVGYPNKGWRSAIYTHHSRPRTLSATGFHLASLAALGWPAPSRPTTPRLQLAPAWRDEARGALRTLGIPDASRLAGFHPGARWPTRRWAPENFTRLARQMLAAHDDTIALITAGPGERAAAEQVAADLPAGRAHVIADWPLTRFVALQSLCSAFVCGDTGPMHTAVAAGARTLGLMSRNRPAMFFPYPLDEGHRVHHARVECSPCHRDECSDLRCLTRLTVEGAWRLLDEILGMASK
ncbi:MAG: glycosyltransferase family 9 protein [Candidatus Eisenbacteria bacterium]